MRAQSDWIEELLFAEEDASLDFKRDQYLFEGADKEVKSELLKDILAFVNAFRRADAYILIGIEEVRGSRSTVVGVQNHLDDAQLQQFVNSKTQVPVTFSYRATTHDGLPVGIIHIPTQPRPVYATANYGKVTKEAVYIRRGSSTAIAKPEEIMRMGAGNVAQPTVRLYVVERDTGLPIGEDIVVEDCTWFDVPSQEEIPDYRPGTPVGTGVARFIQEDTLANSSYYRDLAKYLQTGVCFRATLELENTSGRVIHDASLAIEVSDPDRIYEMLGSTDRPRSPARSTTALLNHMYPAVGRGDVLVRREGGMWKVNCRFGKIQPHARVRLEEDLLIGSRAPKDVALRGRVYGDNVVTPIPVGFSISFSSGARRLSVQDIKVIAKSLSRGD